MTALSTSRALLSVEEFLVTDAIVSLPTVGVEFPVAELYERLPLA